jgi:hypothetical protein
VVGKISLPADYLTDCARNKREDWLNLQIAHGEGKVWSGKSLIRRDFSTMNLVNARQECLSGL